MLSAARFKEASYQRMVYRATVEPETTVDEILHTGYWANMANRLKPYDVVEVIDDDGTFFIELMVIVVDGQRVVMKVMREVKLTTDIEMPEGSENYIYKFRGPHKKHSIIDAKTKEVIKEEMESKEVAIKWLEEHLKTIRRVQAA